MHKNFKVSCIYFCSCIFENVMTCIQNVKIKKVNDMMMFFVSIVNGRVLIELYEKSCFACETFSRHTFY